MKKILFIDTETSGLDSSINGVHQIAGIIDVMPISSASAPLEEFNMKMNCLDEGCEIATWMDNGVTKDALSISGVSKEEVLSYPDYKESFDNLLKLFDVHINKFDKKDKFTLVGYNVAFDKDMLAGYAKRVGNKFLFSYIDHRVVDVQSIARSVYIQGLFPEEPKDFKLETLCNMFGIPIDAHDALEDIRATRSLYFKLIELQKA